MHPPFGVDQSKRFMFCLTASSHRKGAYSPHPCRHWGLARQVPKLACFTSNGKRQEQVKGFNQPNILMLCSFAFFEPDPLLILVLEKRLFTVVHSLWILRAHTIFAINSTYTVHPLGALLPQIDLFFTSRNFSWLIPLLAERA